MSETLNIEDPAQLKAYLRDTRRIGESEKVQIRVLSGGVSNRTVLVQRASSEGWVLKQALRKLRVAVEWFSDPARIRREALGLHWLGRLLPHGAVPPLIFTDAENNLLAMAAVPEPHANLKTLLLAGELDPELVRQSGQLLAALHREAAARRAELQPIFADRQFFESLRLEPYYGYAATQLPAAAEFFGQLIADTRATATTLVHGDFSPKNLLVHARRLVLLDHEVIHWGDPAFDVGFALTHFLSKAHHLSARRDNFATAAADFWKTYQTDVGTLGCDADLESRAVRHTLGCLLARVAGRSPLEYLDGAERRRQRDSALGLSPAPPEKITELINRFLTCL